MKNHGGFTSASSAGSMEFCIWEMHFCYILCLAFRSMGSIVLGCETVAGVKDRLDMFQQSQGSPSNSDI